MRDWMWGVLVFVVLIIVMVVSASIFYSTPDVFIIKNPTQEQVEILVRGDPSNRVWFDDATQLYQGSSLIKISFRARYFEGDRIINFLDRVGVKYELIKEGR